MKLRELPVCSRIGLKYIYIIYYLIRYILLLCSTDILLSLHKALLHTFVVNYEFDCITTFMEIMKAQLTAIRNSIHLTQQPAY